MEIDIENIPLDDEKTFAMLSRGETMGLFQLNGSGVTNFLKRLRPSTIYDINVMVALYRPGPMANIDEYIKRKHDPSLITYPDERMRSYLKESLGVIVYQEDVLLSAINLAGYSWLEADKFRKAMGKKIPKVMAAEKNKLVAGLKKHGQTEAFAEQLWKLFEPFQGYGFNKAHAASYGKVAYQTAYMKANYPVEYMSAILTADAGDTDKISEIINECKRMNITILPPDINESFADFSVVPDRQTIRFGLETIKNFGSGIAETIIKERKVSGPFVSLTDFLTRIHDKNLNRKSLESLIVTGALDRFGERGLLFANINTMLTFNKEQSDHVQTGQDSLFGDIMSSVNELTLVPATPADTKQKLQWEKELLGIYVSGHPLEEYTEELKKYGDIGKIKADGRNGIPITSAGMIEKTRELLTKKGDLMSFVQLDNRSDQIETVLFPEVYAKNRQLVAPGNCVAIKGQLNIRNGEPTVIIEKIKILGTTKDNPDSSLPQG